jgi:hypothetical protein
MRINYDSNLIAHQPSNWRPPWVCVVDAHIRGSGGGAKLISEYVIEHAARLSPWQKWRP